MIHHLCKKNSVANRFLAELRDEKIQQDRLRFRRNLERLGEIMAYEISQTLEYAEVDVETPLGVAKCHLPTDRIILATILRAGLPFHNGMLNYFDDADNAFIGSYRLQHKDGTFDIQMEYTSSPSIDESTLIVSDPMLATGASMVLAIEELLNHGQPKEVHVVTTIATNFAIDRLKRLFPNTIIWTADIDDELTAKSYIVPGLGDAGDLSFGNKT